MEKEIGREVKERIKTQVCNSILNRTLCNNWRIPCL